MSSHDPERRALWRAAVLLVALSAVRWGASWRSGEPVVPADGEPALVDHMAATDSAADEADRRGRPLEEGERVDPNVASEVELDRLPGVGPSTASAIVAARDTLGFVRPEDLLEVRGIGAATLERIRPWIRMEARGRRSGGRRASTGAASREGSASSTRPSPAESALGAGPGPSSAGLLIDLNRADAQALQTLPGIGPALAARIVEARREGPFRSLDDLARVRGIGPATVARLKARAGAGGRHR